MDNIFVVLPSVINMFVQGGLCFVNLRVQSSESGAERDDVDKAR